VLNPLSYHQARNHSVPAGSVYVAQAGYLLGRAGVPQGAVIEAIDGRDVANLDEAEAALAALAQGERFTIRLHHVTDPARQYLRVAVMDRTWYPMQRCVRDDTTGYWPCTPSAQAPPPVAERRGSALPFATDSKVGARLAPSLVMVDVDIPHPTAGVKDFNFQGAGVVIDAARGWVLVDRDTVPVALADIEITFAGAVRVPGRLVWLHPVHNLAVIAYDPALVTDVPIAAVALSDRPLAEDDAVWQVGLDADQRVVAQTARVDELEGLYLGTSSSPRFRDLNLEVADLTESVGSLGGVLADRKGRARALWASFLDPGSDGRTFHGLPVAFLPRWLREGREPEAYCFAGFEVGPISLADAIDRGLPDADARRIIAAEPVERKLLQVTRVMGASRAAAAGLRGGDVIVAWAGPGHDGPLTRERQLEAASEDLCEAPAQVQLLRDRAMVDVSLDGTPLDGEGTDRAVSFAGLLVHEPHPDVAMQYQEGPRGPYIAWLWYGSPAYRHGLRPTRQILALDGTETPDLDAFLAAVRDLGDRDSVRIRTVNRQGRVEVETLRTDLHYWPTQILQRHPDGTWERTDLTVAGE
jgi:S1-C subfamily serine protease